MKIQRAGQIIGGGLLATVGGAMACAVAGSLSFGIIHAAILWCMSSPGNSGPFLPYNIQLGFSMGAGFGMTVGGIAWFFPGLLRAARRRPFPWWRLTKTVMIGALIGTTIMALNSGLYLVYLARTDAVKLGGSMSSVQFLNTGRLPGKIGPILVTDMPMFTLLIGLLLGIGAGTGWGLRTPKQQTESL